MCVALTAAQYFAANATMMVMQHQQSAAQAKGQERYNEAMSQYNSDVAVASAVTQYEALGSRITQSQAALADDIHKANRHYRQAVASGAVAATEGGVRGGTVNEIEASFSERNLDYQTKKLMNQNWFEGQVDRQLHAVTQGLQANLIAASPKPVAEPSMIDLAGSLFGAYTDTMGMYGNVEDGKMKMDWNWSSLWPFGDK